MGCPHKRLALVHALKESYNPNRRNAMSYELTYRGVTYTKQVKATSGVKKASK